MRYQTFYNFHKQIVPSNLYMNNDMGQSVFAQLPGYLADYDATNPLNNNTQPSDGASISRWADVSGHGNDLTASGAGMPTFKIIILNGLPVVRFNGTTNFMSRTRFTGSIHTVSIVCASTSTPAGGIVPIYNGNSGVNGYGYYITNARNILFGGHAIKADSTADLAYNIITMAWDGVTSFLYINGVATSITGATTTPGIPTGSFQIGAATGGNFFPGDIARCIVRNVALSSAQVAIEVTALKGIYNIS